MSLSSFMKDTVSLIKKNGKKTDGIRASVQKRKIFINHKANILIETGDLIHRKMSNGGEETYEVIDPGFYERHGGIPAHYQMDVKKVTRCTDSLAKDSKHLESVDNKETQNVIKVFISHSSKDQKVVEKLIELVKNALPLSSNEIRCTSIDGHRLPGGADTNEQLKSEVRGTKVFIGVISYAAIDSMYVLFELGARWGANKHLLPLLAPGVSSDILESPLSGLNALSCDSASQLHQLVNDLAKELGIKPEGAQAYQRYIDAIRAIPTSEDKKLSVGSDLDFDKKTGTYISEKKLRYCGKCLKSTPSTEVPLTEQDNGWHCNVCEKFYPNPNYNPPRRSAYGNNNPFNI